MTSFARVASQATVVLALASVPAGAQHALSAVALPVGTKVRVTAPEVHRHRITGRVISRDSAALTISTLRGQAPLSIDTRQVRTLDVSRGRNRWLWALLGGGVGLLGGAVVGAELGSRNDTNGLGGLAGFIAGGSAGLATGIVAGAVAAPERWTRYRFTTP